jgi:serine/threonine-protein kinase
MTDDTRDAGTSSFRTAGDDGSVEAGIALVLRAEDGGDWKPVAEWLARHPEAAPEVDGFLAVQQKLRPVVGAVAEPVPVPSGTTIGRYVLGEEIGRGGAAIVYRAFDPKFNRDIALKLVRTGEASAAERARFLYEAKMVAALRHPNIVTVYDFSEEGAVPYIAMPLMSGSLAKRLKDLGPDRRLPAKEAAEIVRAVALGVHHAHQRGLIHRDLKPGNFLLDEAGAPHVADFGLAREVDVTLSVAGSISGTVPYMAPEQARGEAVLTTAVDVWALGAVLFELLTGRTPFTGDVPTILRKLTDPNEQPPPVRRFRPDVDGDLEAICLKCLEKRPEDRYASASEVADDLDNYLHGRAVKARPPGFWDWLRQLARTRPEPHPDYSWPVTVWFGAAILAANAAIYLLARGAGSALDVWLVNIIASIAMTVVLWWYMLRRFRHLPITERHSLIIAVGKIIVYFPVMLAYVPFSTTAPASTAQAIYPPLGAISGLAFFVLGSTNWSRFFPVGLGMMALTPAMAWWPEESPLIYAAAVAFVLWYWSVAKKDGFGHTAEKGN